MPTSLNCVYMTFYVQITSCLGFVTYKTRKEQFTDVVVVVVVLVLVVVVVVVVIVVHFPNVLFFSFFPITVLAKAQIW